MYRVHPLPESLIDVVSDFGSLSEASEEQPLLAWDFRGILLLFGGWLVRGFHFFLGRGLNKYTRACIGVL